MYFLNEQQKFCYYNLAAIIIWVIWKPVNAHTLDNIELFS